jgi:hypothetical protein
MQKNQRRYWSILLLLILLGTTAQPENKVAAQIPNARQRS